MTRWPSIIHRRRAARLPPRAQAGPGATGAGPEQGRRSRWQTLPASVPPAAGQLPLAKRQLVDAAVKALFAKAGSSRVWPGALVGRRLVQRGHVRGRDGLEEESESGNV